MEKKIYRTLTAREIYIGLDVIYHPIIQSDNILRVTKILSEVMSLGKDSVVKVKDEAECVFLDSIELKTEYSRRKTNF